jgi:hypothetical protein
VTLEQMGASVLFKHIGVWEFRILLIKTCELQ